MSRFATGMFLLLLVLAGCEDAPDPARTDYELLRVIEVDGRMGS